MDLIPCFHHTDEEPLSKSSGLCLWPVAGGIIGIHTLVYLAPPSSHLIPHPLKENPVSARGRVYWKARELQSSDPCPPSTPWGETEMKQK